jgi:hypothetical protein
MTPLGSQARRLLPHCGGCVRDGLYRESYIRAVTLSSVLTPFRVTKSSNPRATARRLVEALAKGETVSCTAYGRRRLRGHDVDAVLHKIDVLVSAELPAVRGGYLHRRGGERFWLWSLGEPKPVAWYGREEPDPQN